MQKNKKINGDFHKGIRRKKTGLTECCVIEHTLKVKRVIQRKEYHYAKGQVGNIRIKLQIRKFMKPKTVPFFWVEAKMPKC